MTPLMPSPDMPVGKSWPWPLDDRRPVYDHLHDGPIDYWPVDLPCPSDREDVLAYSAETGQATCPVCGDVAEEHNLDLSVPERDWTMP